MAIISYHASHEQFTPSELLSYAIMAEKAGFDACHSSDHFHPWSVRQGQSGFAFSWLGAAMQATSFPFSLINAPGQRYHPAIVTQAIATLAEMFPGRLDVALGSGEALNELITGDPWPEKRVRNQRLLECVYVMRRLFNGEMVSHDGFIKIKNATLFTRPQVIPKIFAAAITEETSRWTGSWADGLLITYQPGGVGKNAIAFKEGGGEGKPLHVQMAISYARTEQAAIDGAYDQWRTLLVGIDGLENFSRPEQFDEAAKAIQYEDLKNNILISSDLNAYVSRIEECIEAGFENIILHNVNRNQQEFIEDFGREVLPQLKRRQSTSGAEVII